MAEISQAMSQEQAAPAVPRLRPTSDPATLFGVLGAFAVIGLAMVLGGSPRAFLDLPALLIVVFGTLLVTAVSYSWEEFRNSQQVVWRAVVYHCEDPGNAAAQVLYLADIVRKRGKLAIEDSLEEIRHNRFLHRAMTLVVDGLPAEEVERILQRETQATQARHLRSAGILRRAGEVAPAMGLIGTLVGLVQMLGNLEDPAAIGPSMAVALLTTFYGAVLAHMVFIPLASKLDRNAQAEARVNHIYSLGAASMSRQENPRRLELGLNAILAPQHKTNYFNSPL
ncbi:MAG TPA: MotA/TolQ/ExbB proton channel family protein [Kiloniellaceae bacterium]|nr:MotA/TolQ/ExbB proton channel family protein [Kiloniellaceae bacterium]